MAKNGNPRLQYEKKAPSRDDARSLRAAIERGIREFYECIMKEPVPDGMMKVLRALDRGPENRNGKS